MRLTNFPSQNIFKKRSLSDWIIDFNQKFLDNKDLSEENREIIINSFSNNSNIKNNFYNNFLPNMLHNLNCPSSKENYNYEYFFKIDESSNFEFSNNNNDNFDRNVNTFKTSYSTSSFTKENLQKNKNIQNNTNQKEGDKNRDNHSMEIKNVNRIISISDEIYKNENNNNNEEVNNKIEKRDNNNKVSISLI